MLRVFIATLKAPVPVSQIIDAWSVCLALILLARRDIVNNDSSRRHGRSMPNLHSSPNGTALSSISVVANGDLTVQAGRDGDVGANVAVTSDRNLAWTV
jgi:hypothetical protein